jgi:hypothetical protein
MVYGEEVRDEELKSMVLGLGLWFSGKGSMILCLMFKRV